MSSSGATTRKYRPLPPQPLSQQQSRDYSGNNRPSVIYSPPSTSAGPARRCTDGSTTTKVALKRDHNAGARGLSESENILDNTPLPSGVIAQQAIYHAQWKRLSFIGRGSYGQVYRALDMTTGYIFAIKEVDSKIKRRTLVQALEDERETLKELEHPNIVHYLGFEEDQGVLNIFLEYIPGGTIRSCLNTHGKFQEEVTKSFASQILQGLSYLHSKLILHRDLKSENILVEPRGICKISDFGISKKALEADKGRLYSMKGTVAYMAPEMVDNKKKGYDSKIDIWSVGCIVFEMWTGKTPWSGSHDFQIFLKLVTGKLAPPLPADVSLSTTAESFRQEFFHFDPEKRPSAVKLLQHVYLKLPSQWVFPGVDKIGQVVSDTCSRSIALVQEIQHLRVSSSQNDPGTRTGHLIQDREEQNSPFESIYSDLEIIAAEMNPSTANRVQRSLSPAWTLYSDVADPRLSSPPLVTLTPPMPRKPRKQSFNLPVGVCATSVLNTSSRKSPPKASRRLVIHNADPDDAEDARPGYPKRRPYVYRPPPLPELNIASPYSRGLIPPISIRLGKSSGQTFSKPIGPSKPSPAKLLTGHGMFTNSPTDATSVSSSEVRLNLVKADHSVGQQRVPYIPPESDDDDSEECYSPSAWKRPPMDIPSRLSQAVKPVESVSDRNSSPIDSHHQPLPSAIPRPSIETLYKGFLSENADLPDIHAAWGSISNERRHTMKNITEVVKERLYRSQIDPAQPQRKTHFWDSHMQEMRG